jgi:AhpD family alkylhydroperoxidase
MNLAALAPGAYKGMIALETYLASCSIEAKLVHLLKLRASQLNGCAYCIDMHWKDLRAMGETEQRLYGLDAWEESPYYTDRERAALRWIEAITFIAEGHASDAEYEAVKQQFSEQEIADLTIVATVINAWNRIAIPSRTPAGSYKPRSHAQ